MVTAATAGAVKKTKAPSSHPPYADMIKRAIRELKERNGSSRQAIIKYIKANYQVDDKVVGHVRRALVSGTKSGNLINTKGIGASGSFRLSEKARSTSAAAKKPKAAKKSPSTPAKKPAVKKAKATPKKPKSPAVKKAKTTPKKAKAPAATTPKKTPTKKPKAAASPKKAKSAKPKKATTSSKPKTPKKK